MVSGAIAESEGKFRGGDVDQGHVPTSAINAKPLCAVVPMVAYLVPHLLLTMTLPTHSTFGAGMRPALERRQERRKILRKKSNLAPGNLRLIFDAGENGRQATMTTEKQACPGEYDMRRR